MEYYSIVKKEMFSHPTTWMNLDDIMLSEMSQEKYYIILVICLE